MSVLYKHDAMGDYEGNNGAISKISEAERNMMTNALCHGVSVEVMEYETLSEV